MAAMNYKRNIFIFYYVSLLSVINIFFTYILSAFFTDFAILKTFGNFFLFGFFLILEFFVLFIFGYLLYFISQFMRIFFLFVFYLSISMGIYTKFYIAHPITCVGATAHNFTWESIPLYAFNVPNLLVLYSLIILFSFMLTKRKLSRKNF